MSEERKEILDKLKDSNWYNELDLTGTRWIELTWKETHLLLDYIKDLQQKVEQLVLENEQLQTELNTKDNIINELEEYIKSEIPEEEFVNSEWYVNILDKLQELKENK